jgi:hypothetical protein
MSLAGKLNMAFLRCAEILGIGRRTTLRDIKITKSKNNLNFACILKKITV